jgi:hypothetical protein
VTHLCVPKCKTFTSKNIHDEDELQKVIEQVNAMEEQNETEDEEDADETLGGTQSNISSARKAAHENLQK